MRHYTLLVFTYGRKACLQRTLESFANRVGFARFDDKVIVDDSADPAYEEWLNFQYEPFGFDVVSHVTRRGFAGAIESGWSEVPPDSDFVFHLEDDFVFNDHVDLDEMAAVLEQHTELVQLALLRQAWNDEERAAGGIIPQHPDDFTQVSDAQGHWWVEHRRFFTTNPSLYRAEMTRRFDWPAVEHSEGIFTHRLLEDPAVRFAFWGRRDDEPRVHHIGEQRVGINY